MIKLTQIGVLAAPSAARRPRLDGIDLLRGLAILCVLMNHVNMRLFLAKIPYTQALPPQLVASLVWSGQYGVQMFFAISGYLITATSLQRWHSLGAVNPSRFYGLRCARLAPLLLALLVTLSMLHAAGLRDFVVEASSGGLVNAWFAALTLHVNVLEARRGYLPASWDILWSLSVEEMFYLVFPLVCRTLGRGRGLAVVLALLVVLGPFARTVLSHDNEIWQEYSYLGGMDAIALGCVTALATLQRRWNAATDGTLGVLGAMLMLVILGGSRQIEAWGLTGLGLDMTILAVGTCMVIAAFAHSPWESPRALAPLKALGRHSYEIYLTHMFWVFALFDGFVAVGKPMRWVPLLFIATVLMSAALGAFLARFLTDPANRWLRRRWRLALNGSV